MVEAVEKASMTDIAEIRILPKRFMSYHRFRYIYLASVYILFQLLNLLSLIFDPLARIF